MATQKQIAEARKLAAEIRHYGDVRDGLIPCTMGCPICENVADAIELAELAKADETATPADARRIYDGASRDMGRHLSGFHVVDLLCDNLGVSTDRARALAVECGAMAEWLAARERHLGAR